MSTDDKNSQNIVSAEVCHGSVTSAKGEYASKRGVISGFEQPPFLKTFQCSGAARTSVQRDGATLPLRKPRSEFNPKTGEHKLKDDEGAEITNPYSSMTSLKQAGSRPESPVSTRRPTGSPGLPEKLRTSELYQKRAAKSNKPTGLDDTILKRLVINGRKVTSEDDGYCSSAPGGESGRAAGLEGAFRPAAVRNDQFPYPPPPSSTSSFKDMRLCSEPPVSPYTKMSSLPPFTYQEISTAPRQSLSSSYTDPPNGHEAVPNHAGSMHSLTTATKGQTPIASSPLLKGGGRQQTLPMLAGRNSPVILNNSSKAAASAGALWRASFSTNSTSSTPSPYFPSTKDTALEMAHSHAGGNREILNDSLESRDDSNTTTTSGSYAFDEDELFVELPPANV